MSTRLAPGAPPPGKSAAPRGGSGLDAALVARRVSALPAMPQAVLEALAMLRCDKSGVNECAERIAVDPALTARALRLANSAFYGVSGRVATLRDAVHLLGRHTLGTLLTAAAVMAQFKDASLALRHHDIYWRHALGVALAAQALARERGIDAEIAFTTGLLHDIGRLALAAYFPAEHQDVLACAREHDIELVDAERARLGLDHTEIGAMVARHWHFPDHVVQAIAWHHHPSRAPRTAGGVQLPDLVHLADAITHALDLNQLPHEVVPTMDSAAWDLMRLTPDHAERVFRFTEDGVATLGQALGL
ncbi:MAG: hypothetical protein RLZZ584_935 [Pseudomonadota bacterium]|jgi:putative nucleotidyltransferase with HDIG domain